MSKKVTIQSLIANKEKIKKRTAKTEPLYIESLEGYIAITEPSRPLCLDAIGMSQDPTNADKADAYVVYNCVTEPNLKDPELQKEFGCVEPTEIVDKIFKPGEVLAISGYCLQMAGYGTDLKQAAPKVDAELKKQ